MKTCSYCGKEYADSETICAVDHEPLIPARSVSVERVSKEPKKPSILVASFQEARRLEIERSIAGAETRGCPCGGSMIAETSRSAGVHKLILFPLAGGHLGGAKAKRTLCYRCKSCGFEFRLFRADLMIAAAVCVVIYGAALAFAFTVRNEIERSSWSTAIAIVGGLLIWSASILGLGLWARIKYPVIRAAKTPSESAIRNAP